MPYSKRSKSADRFFRNFEDVCPRCSRIVNNVKKRHNPKLLSYYKNLCRSSKCLIHRMKCSPEPKKTKTKAGKTPQIIKADRLSIGDTFDDDDVSSLDSIDFEMFTKIEASVEDLDVSEAHFKNLVGHGQIKDVINEDVKFYIVKLALLLEGLRIYRNFLIQRTIIWPLKKPEIFKGLRTAPKGILLFGPPGTGKTSIGKFIAFETNSTFFNISASTLSSKWMGETEKLVRTLFLVAKARQPSIIFIDEIDSILSERTNDENESTKRMKNEFLFCMSTIDTSEKSRVLVIGATSRPQELDETIRPKFVKRIYIPLPDEKDRKEILMKLIECECHSLEESDINDVVRRTEGFSIVDLKNLCQEAAMGSIKTLTGSAIFRLKPKKIRPILVEDFHYALRLIKPTVSDKQVDCCKAWDSMYGYGGEDNAQMRRNMREFYQNNPYII